MSEEIESKPRSKMGRAERSRTPKKSPSRKTVAERVTAMATARAAAGKLSAVMSRDTITAMAEANDERRARTAAKTFVPVVNDGWKGHKDTWATADEDTRKGMLYDMVLWRGYVMGRKNVFQRVARFFGVRPDDISKNEDYVQVMWMADEARCAIIDESVLRGFLLSDKDASGKFHVQNQYAYKVASPAWEGVDAVNEAPTQIVFNEVKGQNQELRDELETIIKKREEDLAKKLN